MKKPKPKVKPSPLPIRVGIIMGSVSDWECMQEAAVVLKASGIGHETLVVSAHRTPEKMVAYAQGAVEKGLQVIIAGAGGAAHLPGMVASLTDLPVIGVPVSSRQLKGLDSLLSIVQMPAGIPVATVAIGNAKNAAYLAMRILGCQDPKIQEKVAAHRASMRKEVEAMQVKLPA